MDLWQKIVESETLGYMQNLYYGLTARILGGMSETEADKRMRVELTALRDEDNERTEQAVRAFIGAHPELDPDNFGIPSLRYSCSSYFVAVRAVSMLLDRNRRRLPECRADAFILWADGTICAQGDVIPDEITRHEVYVFIQDQYLIEPQNMTLNRRKARRLEQERLQVQQTHPELFLRWIQAALRVQPNLLHEYRVTGASADGTGVRLEHVPDASYVDSLGPWLIG